MSAEMTIRELALQLGVSHSALGHWETNRHVPHYRMLVRVARLTSVDVEWMVTGSGELPQRPVMPRRRTRTRGAIVPPAGMLVIEARELERVQGGLLSSAAPMTAHGMHVMRGMRGILLDWHAVQA